MSDREHQTDKPWPCSCKDCSRQAAHAWTGLMRRVRDGDLSLAEAQAIQDRSDRG